MILFGSIGVIVLFVWLLTNNGTATEPEITNQNIVPPPTVVSDIPIVAEPEQVNAVISLPRKFRRAQQSLLRQQQAVTKNMKEMHHQGQVLDISAKLVDISTQQIALQEEALDLKLKTVDVAQKELHLQERESLLTIGNAAQGLKDIKQAIRDLLLDQKEGEIAINFQKKVNELNGIEVQLEKMGLTHLESSLQNQSKAIALQKIDLEQSLREGLIKLDAKNLDNKKGEVANLIGNLNIKERSIQLSERELKLSFADASEQYKKLLNDILIESRNLQLDRKQNNLEHKEANLDLKETRLKDLTSYMNQMYMIKSEWLKIQSKDNDLSYREQKLRLDEQYTKTRNGLAQLRLYRQENSVMYREEKLRFENMISDMQYRWRW